MRIILLIFLAFFTFIFVLREVDHSYYLSDIKRVLIKKCVKTGGDKLPITGISYTSIFPNELSYDCKEINVHGGENKVASYVIKRELQLNGTYSFILHKEKIYPPYKDKTKKHE